jgi:hypothetical protein
MVFKKEILKVSNEHAPTPSTPYVKKDTLFTKNSSDDDSDNERKEDDIPPNLTESDEMMILGRSLRIVLISQNEQVLPHGSHYRRVVLQQPLPTMNNTIHLHTKHINVKYHFTQFQIDEGIITLIDTRTKDQLVDLFTKQQMVKQHTKDCKQFGLDLEQTKTSLFERVLEWIHNGL